jgi:hypothetical protein
MTHEKFLYSASFVSYLIMLYKLSELLSHETWLDSCEWCLQQGAQKQASDLLAGAQEVL